MLGYNCDGPEQCESPKVLVSEALLKIAREAILLEANTCRHSQAGTKEFWERRARMLDAAALEITELIRGGNL